jgi:hypothetical protein
MRSRRFLFVVVLAALLAGAIASGRGADGHPQALARTSVAPNASLLSGSQTVWFCPGLPPALPRAAARMTFSNTGDAPADVVVTDLADSATDTHVMFNVAANSVVTKARDLLGAPGALTVETFGGRVIVEQGINGTGALETMPCATESSPHWYFAAGTTPRGVQQWLVIDNPYASDAKVDVTLRTDAGVRRPDALQGLDVARRSREVIAIHDLAVRLDRVSVEVDAQVGSVVAAQTLVYSAAAGTPGVAQSLGSPVVSTEWTFTGGIAEPGATAVVAIANVGDGDAQVDVQATAEVGTTPLAPTSLTVAQDEVVWVQLGQCPSGTKASGTNASGTKGCIRIGDGVRYSLDIRSEQNVAIVAQTMTRFANGAGTTGTLLATGATQPARAWAFGRSSVNGVSSTLLSFFNPGADPALVNIGLVRGGTVGRSRALQRITVPPGRAVTVTIFGDGASKPPKLDAALVIDADHLVFVERSIFATDEATTSAGVVVGD